MLSDPEKKEIYDQYGEEGLKEGMGDGANESIDPFDVLAPSFPSILLTMKWMVFRSLDRAEVARRTADPRGQKTSFKRSTVP